MMRNFFFSGGIISGHGKNPPIIQSSTTPFAPPHEKLNFVFCFFFECFFFWFTCVVVQHSVKGMVGLCWMAGLRCCSRTAPLATKMRSPFIKLRAVKPVSCSYGYRGPPFE
jgi:hypothetical protein